MLRVTAVLCLALLAVATPFPRTEHTPKWVGDSTASTIQRTTRQVPGTTSNARMGVTLTPTELPAQIYNLYLSIGQSVLEGIRNTQAAILSLVPQPIVPVPIVAGIGRTFAVDSPKSPKLLEDPAVVPTVFSGAPSDRAGRQFGLGFSGSGAQASSSSFGGGGGFGGFPGGFGGGFSGSQASAGASSFGGGGGFFG